MRDTKRPSLCFFGLTPERGFWAEYKYMNTAKFLKIEAKKYIKEIKDKHKPEKIIIFDSLAAGKIKSGSDIDFFIVKKQISRGGRGKGMFQKY